MGDHAIVGGHSGVLQRVRIGTRAMVPFNPQSGVKRGNRLRALRPPRPHTLGYIGGCDQEEGVIKSPCLGDHAIVGGHSGVLQRVRIGTRAMVRLFSSLLLSSLELSDTNVYEP